MATEDGSAGTKGTVLDAIKEKGLSGDVIFACGPMPMLRAIKEYAAANNMEAYISLEEHMACGVGACLGCVCKTKMWMPIRMYTIHGSVQTDRFIMQRR